MKAVQLHLIRFVFLFILSLTTHLALSQNQEQFLVNSILQHHLIGVQIQANAVPKASVNTITGNYQLQSKLQCSFSGGFVYQLNLDSDWNVSYGLQLNIVSTNYFLHISDIDLSGYPSTQGAPQIEDKQVYYKIALPALLSYNFFLIKKDFIV